MLKFVRRTFDGPNLGTPRANVPIGAKINISCFSTFDNVSEVEFVWGPNCWIAVPEVLAGLPVSLWGGVRLASQLSKFSQGYVNNSPSTTFNEFSRHDMRSRVTKTRWVWSPFHVLVPTPRAPPPTSQCGGFFWQRPYVHSCTIWGSSLYI